MNKKEYLENRIKPIMENLIFQLVLERPEEPTAFMVDWLQKTAGYNLNGLKPEEKEEMAILKKDIMKYRQKEKENNSFDKEEEEDFVYDMDDENRKGRKNIEGRKAISAEAYGNIIKRKNSNRDIYRNQIRKLQELKVEYYSLFYSTHLKRKMSALSLGLWKKKHSTRVM